MRATDIIRGVLDLIDQVECNNQPMDSVIAVDLEPKNDQAEIQTGLDTNRFKHIYAMLDAERSNQPMYDNSPVETVANIDSVTKDAGGGWNGPKNPADMRSNNISMYPSYQATKE